ncbi:MAG: PxKF domain-containing protein [Gemmatimonadales bacterium]
MLGGHDALTNCGLASSGSITCWGLNDHNQLSAPTSGGPFVQVSMGSYHGCALTAAGGVVCWGEQYPAPGWDAFAPAGITGVASVVVGAGRTCVLMTDGTVQCFGFGYFQKPADLNSVIQIDAGGSSVCALKADGSVTCWGADYGQVTPPADLGPVVQVSTGTYNSCGLKSTGTVRCWGDNSFGVDDTPADLTTAIQVSVGDLHACALKSNGTVECWGGIAAFGMSVVPADLPQVRQIASGALNTCALLNDGSVRCWGYEGYGSVPDDLNLGALAPPPQVAQSISFTSTSPNPAYVAATYIVTATASSALDVTLSLSAGTPSSVCTLSGSNSGSTVTFTGAGTCTIAADQAGNAGYLAATQQTQSIAIEKRTQSVSFSPAPTTPALIGTGATLNASSGGSSNPVVFTSLAPTVCSVDGTSVSYLSIGTCVIAANQAGDPSYLAAPQITASVVVIWPFGGFEKPTVGSPSFNSAKGGATVVVKFSLGGNRGTSVLAPNSPTTVQVSCTTGAILGTASQATGSITYDASAGTYAFGWRTDKTYSSTCQKLVFLLADGTTHFALFTFK